MWQVLKGFTLLYYLLGKKKKGRVEKKKAYDIWGKELVEGSLCRRTMTKYYWIMTKYWI